MEQEIPTIDGLKAGNSVLGTCVELRPPKELTPQAWPIIALRPSVHQLLLHFYVILCTELLSSACI